ncbi:phospholipid-binding protein MlaC [Thermodesulfobacteriota bacterium]
MEKVVATPFFRVSAFASSGEVSNPLDTIQGPVAQILNILKDPRYRNDGQKNEQLDKIWETVRTIFDFNEMAKRSVGKDWKRFSAQEQSEFTEAFTQLLGNVYLSKIQSEYKDERVVFLGQEMVSESKALVKTNIVRDALEIPVHYSLYQSDAGWRVYDVNIEGVSLVANYRNQFKDILLKNTPAQLIEQVKKKVAQQKSAL